MSNRTEAHITTAPVIRPLTYTEAQGREPFDWWKALKQAQAAGLTQQHADIIPLVARAKSWVCCAVGNQCAIIPRDEDGQYPLDTILCNLGIIFSDEVRDAEWNKALCTLAAIEARSAALIAALT